MGRHLTVLTIIVLLLCSIFSAFPPLSADFNEGSVKIGMTKEQLSPLDSLPPNVMYGTSQSSIFDNSSMVFDMGRGIGYTEGATTVSNAVAVDSNGDVYVVGDFTHTTHFGTISLTSQGNYDIFVAKMFSNGSWDWAISAGASSSVYGKGIAVDSNGSIYVSGHIEGGPVTFGDSTLQHGNSYDAYVAKINSNGTWSWVLSVNGAHYEYANAVAVDGNNNVFITGYYYQSIDFTDNMSATVFSLASVNVYTPYVAKINNNGTWAWAKRIATASSGYGYAITADVAGNAYVTGHYPGSATFGDISIATNSNAAYVAKLNSTGSWIWAVGTGGSDASYGRAIAVDNAGDVYIAGDFSGGDTFDAGGSLLSSGGSDVFVAKLNSTGSWIWAKSAGGSYDDKATALTLTNGGILVSGYFEVSALFGPEFQVSTGGWDVFVSKLSSTGSWVSTSSIGSAVLDHSSGIAWSQATDYAFVVGRFAAVIQIEQDILFPQGSTDAFIGRLSRDYDGDNEADALDDDDDGDLVPDIWDGCHYSSLGFVSTPAVDHDGDGCYDLDADDDDDGDSLTDGDDDCPLGVTGWISNNATDFDGDGCSDAMEDDDDDNDGIEDVLDLCPKEVGNSTFEYEEGCPDTDGDGRPDIRDVFPSDDIEWEDLDGDGVGDNADEFDADPTQQTDTDGDGFGDYEYGNGGDACSDIFGTSTIDRNGCPDSDGDGWSDGGDDFPDDPDEHLDTDGDLVPDHLDAFPFDPTQVTDIDGDGYGDNANGNLADAYPNDPERHADSDGDTYDDDADAFPFDPTQWADRDGDNYGDNPVGLRPDAFPTESTQWSDVDGDGWGDNQTGNNPDAFPTDITQWMDTDGDGYGDNPLGINPDAYPKDHTQWADFDQDGYGDNPNGTNPDPFLNDTDNDGYNNSIDPLPNVPSPGDMDNDMCPDEMDDFPSNPNECKDTDGDGWGDNQDADDDGDGVNDIIELQKDADPMDASSVPVESFEIVVPGTAIGLGAWDLIGIFGGVPLFSWLGLCLITRGSRTRRFEQRLFTAGSEEELSEISDAYEWALMWRMIGPHQALRLERIRSNLEVNFNELERQMKDDPSFEIGKVDPGEALQAPAREMQGMVHTDGYEWIDHGGRKWYRVANTNAEWTRWQ